MARINPPDICKRHDVLLGIRAENCYRNSSYFWGINLKRIRIDLDDVCSQHHGVLSGITTDGKVIHLPIGPQTQHLYQVPSGDKISLG